MGRKSSRGKSWRRRCKAVNQHRFRGGRTLWSVNATLSFIRCGWRIADKGEPVVNSSSMKLTIRNLAVEWTIESRRKVAKGMTGRGGALVNFPRYKRCRRTAYYTYMYNMPVYDVFIRVNPVAAPAI